MPEREPLRLTVVSDTHNNYPELPGGDVLIHCGDLTSFGSEDEIRAGLRWLDRQSHEVVLLVPGNHDRGLAVPPDALDRLLRGTRIQLLCDWGVNIRGWRFYGTPWTPLHADFAFMAPPDGLRVQYRRIPENLDVLVSHGPPFGTLDMGIKGDRLGSAELADALDKLGARRPKVHVFGHIHEGYGGIAVGNACSYNASWVGLGPEGPRPPNPPWEVVLRD